MYSTCPFFIRPKKTGEYIKNLQKRKKKKEENFSCFSVG